MDFGRLDDGSFYLVLELVTGRSLTEELRKGPLAQLARSRSRAKSPTR